MDDPLATLTALEGVASGMTATRDGIDALLRDRGLRRTTPDLTGESLLRGAHASGVLAGSESSWELVHDDGGDPMARAAVRVSAELLGLVPTLQQSPLQALARLHTLAAKGAVADDDLGRPRDPESARRLHALARLLTATRRPRRPSSSRPWCTPTSPASRRSCRTTVSWRVPRSVWSSWPAGWTRSRSIVPEAGHLALRAEYESNLRAYRDGGRAGVHAWLLYATEAYARGAEASPLNA